MNGDGEDVLSLGRPSLGGDDEDERARQEANQHVASYVTDQLERIRSHDSDTLIPEDEFEAQLDGQ